MLCPSRRLTLDDIAAATKQRVLTVCAGRIATGGKAISDQERRARSCFKAKTHLKKTQNARQGMRQHQKKAELRSLLLHIGVLRASKTGAPTDKSQKCAPFEPMQSLAA